MSKNKYILLGLLIYATSVSSEGPGYGYDTVGNSVSGYDTERGGYDDGFPAGPSKQDVYGSEPLESYSGNKPLDFGITYQGCFSFPNYFIYKTFRRTDDYNNNLKCAIACQYEGYILALTNQDLCVCTNDLPYKKYLSNRAGVGSGCSVTCPGVNAAYDYECIDEECCGGGVHKGISVFSVWSTGNIDLYAQIKRRVYRALTVEGKLGYVFGESFYCPASGYGNSKDVPPDHIELDVADTTLHLKTLKRVLKKNVSPYWEAVPLGNYDSKLDNSDSPQTNVLSHAYEFTDIYVDSYSTDSGYSHDVSVSVGADPEDLVKVLGLPGKAAASFGTDAAEGSSWSSSYGHGIEEEIVQGFDVSVVVPPYSIAYIYMFLEKDIYDIKWRAKFHASGFITIRWCGRFATLHLSQLLDKRGREYFAFGSAKYHERYTFGAKVEFFDRHGNKIGEEVQIKGNDATGDKEKDEKE